MVWCLTAPSHYLGQCCLSLVRFGGIQQRVTTQSAFKLCNMSEVKFIPLKLLPHGQWVMVTFLSWHCHKLPPPDMCCHYRRRGVQVNITTDTRTLIRQWYSPAHKIITPAFPHQARANKFLIFLLKPNTVWYSGVLVVVSSVSLSPSFYMDTPSNVIQ